MAGAARLYRTIVPVADIEAAAKFYGEILAEPGRRVSGGRHYFGSLGDGCILALYSPADDGDSSRYGVEWRPHPLQYVYFLVDDLEAARLRCFAAGAGG